MLRYICRDDFTAYADACFQSFGDRVKHWVTLNEPNMEPISSYSNGMMPPRRCSDPFCSSVNCTKGNSSTEPYIAAHHLLLAHASAVSLLASRIPKDLAGRRLLPTDLAGALLLEGRDALC